jgi:GNAT superfamily N-acetyltransferase
MPACEYCIQNAHYRDRRGGHYLCPAHARIEVVAVEGERMPAPTATMRSASPADGPAIARLARYFWGETEVECFGRVYSVDALPAFLSCDADRVVGALAYAAEDPRLLIVMLNVLPDYQGHGIASRLLGRARDEAERLGLSHLAVATSNDDLPALLLYQRWGFRITGVLAGRLVEHHGGEETGFGGIPARDEIQLSFSLLRS